MDRYYLDLNDYISELDVSEMGIDTEKLTLEEAINNGKEIIKRAKLEFCTIAVMCEVNEEEVYGWVAYNNAFNDEPEWIINL